MPRPKKRRPSPVQPINRVEVHRTFHGESWHLRILSPVYGGLFIHWIGGRGEYCPGEGQCMPAYHKMRRHWRGYCAAERYQQAVNKWQPTVLELTEALELTMRPRFFRGQVWRIWRAEYTRKSVEPVRGEELEAVAPDLLPPEFDIRPVLLTLYNVEAIELDQPNPQALPLVLGLSAGPAPPQAKGLRGAELPEGRRPSDAQREELHKRMKGIFPADPARNGYH